MTANIRQTDTCMHAASLQSHAGASIRDSSWMLSGKPCFAAGRCNALRGIP
jgi:hypothetical protein